MMCARIYSQSAVLGMLRDALVRRKSSFGSLERYAGRSWAKASPKTSLHTADPPFGLVMLARVWSSRASMALRMARAAGQSLFGGNSPGRAAQSQRRTVCEMKTHYQGMA